MNDKKLTNILEACLFIVFGIIIAVCGPSTALDIWFAVGFLVTGVLCIGFAIFTSVNTKVLPLNFLAIGCVGVTLASAIFANWLSFSVLIPILVFSIIGFGGALIIHGIFVLAAYRNLPIGLFEILLGLLGLIFGIVYILVPDFRKPFWIIAGIMVAVYGVFYLILAILEKDYKTVSKK